VGTAVVGGGDVGANKAATTKRKSSMRIRRGYQQPGEFESGFDRAGQEDGNDASLRITWPTRSTAGDCSPGPHVLMRRRPAFADCIDQLKPVLSQDVKSVEALVLQSACYAASPTVERWSRSCCEHGRTSGSTPRSKLAPRNPRAVLLSSMDGLARAKPGTAERQPCVRAAAACRAIIR